MPRLFFGNFDFEESLIRPERQPRPDYIVRILAELASTWVAVVQADDLIWCPHSVDESFIAELQAAGWPLFGLVRQREKLPADCQFVPWGWTNEAVEFAASIGADCHPPPLETVRCVNSRVFGWELERSLGVSLEGSFVALDQQSLLAGVDRLTSGGGKCLVKTEYSHAGRDRFIATSDDATGLRRLQNWAQRQLTIGQRLVIEPWLDAVAEVGIQFDISLAGDVSLVGAAELIPSPRGSYVGSVVIGHDSQAERWSEAVAIATRAAQAVAAEGYFGPLGIDAMQYHTRKGTLAVRPIQDVNARWTMGRLSLGLRRFVPAGNDACWLHGRTINRVLADRPRPVDNRRVIATSPRSIDDRPVAHATALVIEPR